MDLGDKETSDSQPPEAHLQKSLHYAVLEVAYASVFANLIGGVILTGYAISLGATNVEIGILAALPSFVNMTQLVASYLIERSGTRREISLFSVWYGRGIWLLIAGLTLLCMNGVTTYALRAFLWLYALWCVTNSFIGLGFLAWLNDLCPEDMRGRFFAKRSFAAGITGILAAMGGGAFLDWWVWEIHQNQMVGFTILFTVAVLFGWRSAAYTGRMHHPPVFRSPEPEVFFKTVLRPFQKRNFRWLIYSRMMLDVSINIAGPFFGVFMLKNMGLSYSFVSLVGAVATATSLLTMYGWGRLSDRYGHKPLLVLSIIGKGLFPLAWLWAGPDTYLLYIIIHVNGIFDSGLNLTASNILLELAPKRNNSVYIAVFATTVGLASAIAPILGGAILSVTEGLSLSLGFATLDHFKFLFLVSGVLRFATLFPLARVHEPEARDVGHVIRVIWSNQSMAVFEGFQQALHYILAPVRFVGSIFNSDSDEDDEKTEE
jgi:MFS family permease